MTDIDPGKDPFLRVLDSEVHLPDAVKRLHSRPAAYTGLCDIERGKGIAIAIALAIGRFPRSGTDVPVSMHIQKEGEVWTWDRNFSGHRTRSELSVDTRRNSVKERFGSLCLWLRPVPSGSNLHIEITRLTVFGVPCPRALLPQSATVEWQDNAGRFRFDVSARVPGLGQWIRYQGWLAPDRSATGDA